jgi:hypothetical protein
VSAAFGRFGFGSTFEDHVSRVLGIARPAVDDLLGAVREAIGDAEYDFRTAEFLGATTFPGSLAPRSVRDHAVSPLISLMLDTSAAELYAMGILDAPPGPCNGLAHA